MKYVSLFSGIDAATVAWHPLGWRAQAFSEIEAFPRAVLAHHYPGVALHGDMTAVDWSQYRGTDLVVGGNPCQAFSVAGLRGGLSDARGNLTIAYLVAVGEMRPRWVVWENVPGVLSIDAGRTFGTFLGGLGELGYGFAYRILDAQHFGVPQRRRRVFVVGYLGDWRPAAAVLFERHSLSGDSAPRREAGKGVAGTLAGGASLGGMGPRGRTDQVAQEYLQVAHSLRAQAQASHRADSETYVPAPHAAISPAIKARDGKGVSSDGDGDGAILVPMVTHSLRADGFDASEDGTGRSMGHAGSHQNGGGHQAVATGMAVRRLTPRECERLQGFPDDYTQVPYRGKASADGPRYKALGNSMTVPCMRWIGERIEAVETVLASEKMPA